MGQQNPMCLLADMAVSWLLSVCRGARASNRIRCVCWQAGSELAFVRMKGSTGQQQNPMCLLADMAVSWLLSVPQFICAVFFEHLKLCRPCGLYVAPGEAFLFRIFACHDAVGGALPRCTCLAGAFLNLHN